MNSDLIRNRFLLLQINDSQFPIGGYSHSYGLETYIQKGIVHNLATAEEYIRRRLKCNFAFSDLLAARLAYEAAKREDTEALDRLCDIMEASRVPKEIREASKRLGSRFVKTLDKMNVAWESGFGKNYLDNRKKGSICHPCAYGVACSCAGIAQRDALESFVYAQSAAMVTNCVKLIPLSQSDGQQMLSELYGLFEEIIDVAENAGEEMLCASSPAFDLRSIQHERLYSRLYMS